MPEVMPREGGLRIYVHARDHGPPHVHVHSSEGSVRIYLEADCIVLDDSESDMKPSDIGRAGRLVAALIHRLL